MTDFLVGFADAVETLHTEFPIVFYAIVAALVLTLFVLLAHIVWTIRAARNAEFAGELDLTAQAELERASPPRSASGPWRAPTRAASRKRCATCTSRS